MNFTNVVLCGNNLELLKSMPDNSVALTVTSPPYDSMRQYITLPPIDRIALGKELYRITMPGGIVAMVVQDQTDDGAKSCTSYRWILDFVDHCNWNLFENVIYKRHGKPGAYWRKRFRVDHEYLPIFVKGKRPRCFDKSHLLIPSKCAGLTRSVGIRNFNGEVEQTRVFTCPDTKCKGTVWEVNASNTEGNKERKMKHPATFPDALASDLIRCFSLPGDLVLDPYVGSGTTAIQAARLERKYCGIDIAPEYCALAQEGLAALLSGNVFAA